MKFSLSLFMGLVVAATSLTASPVTYNINFTGTGLLPTSGQFTYDAMGVPGSAFSDFTVVWNSISFDLTAVANAPQHTFGACAGATPADVLLLIGGDTPCVAGIAQWYGGTYTGISIFGFSESDANNNELLFDELNTTTPGALGQYTGTSTITTAAVPEPSTMSLALTGCGGAAFLSWKRRRRSLATTTPEAAKH